MHCIISRVIFKAFIQINVCHLETGGVLDCENSDCSFHYGDSGTDACGFIARRYPHRRGVIVLEKKRKQEERRKACSLF